MHLGKHSIMCWKRKEQMEQGLKLMHKEELSSNSDRGNEAEEVPCFTLLYFQFCIDGENQQLDFHNGAEDVQIPLILKHREFSFLCSSGIETSYLHPLTLSVSSAAQTLTRPIRSKVGKRELQHWADLPCGCWDFLVHFSRVETETSGLVESSSQWCE